MDNSPLSEIRWIPGSDCLFLASHIDGTLIVYDKDRDDAPFVSEEQAAQDTSEKASKYRLRVKKSVNSPNQKFNPVAVWKVSNQRINAFAFSPNNRHLAVVSQDGSLRIIDYLNEK